MVDTVDINYNGRRLRAELVVQVASDEAARLYAADLDTAGGIVPVWKAHSFTYDGSGNLLTDTVTDGPTSWTRTYVYQAGNQTSDSGWVRNA